MVDNVVSLDDKRPRLSGIAFCLSCRHEWDSVAPVGTVWLECPKCGLTRGHFIYPCERKGLKWECNCGNDLFHLTPDGIYCPNCGAWQEGF